MTCRICKDIGVVTETLSVYGEPQDYEPVDCPCCQPASQGDGSTLFNRAVRDDYEPELV